uniref:Minor capsid protein P9 transmembrane helices domain-containing protein n=1 Tax=Pithovirus LCPAC304 TaxID=2506594 RepID=A0A481Z981_9VIRU|nr:MAG: hypothetical protein LCPAC304_05130 [Pithovirus LCPAC304]
MHPKSSDVLKRWLDGNQLCRVKKKPHFGPSASPHLALHIENCHSVFQDPWRFLKGWDCFQQPHFGEETRINTIARLIIVAFVLLVLVGNYERLGILALGGVFVLILVLWFTMIPTTRECIHSKKPRYPVLVS